jgi:hypothetical protein
MSGRMSPRTAPTGVTAAMRQWASWLLCACMLAALPGGGAQALDAESIYEAYVLNFVRYSRWPDSDSGNGDYVIAVIGPSAIAADLRRLAERNGPVQGHALRVRAIALNTLAPVRREAVRTLQATLDDARVVFVAPSHRSWNGAVIAATAGKPVLTVGIGGDFVRQGGMLALFDHQGRVNFCANEAAIKQSSVDVSARVMVLARTAPTSLDEE